MLIQFQSSGLFCIRRCDGVYDFYFLPHYLLATFSHVEMQCNAAFILNSKCILYFLDIRCCVALKMTHNSTKSSTYYRIAMVNKRTYDCAISTTSEQSNQLVYYGTNSCMREVILQFCNSLLKKCLQK